jgi:hypothetical protein
VSRRSNSAATSPSTARFSLLAGIDPLTGTPKHGAWLNLVEGFFSKFALRHIRVTSKYELKQCIIAGIDEVNRYPVIHTWSYKLGEAA